MLHIPGYSIGQKIYEGKKIVIYNGIKLNDDIPVLLKLLHAEYPNLSDVEKLNNEYELSKKIHSDNIVKIYDIEQYEKSPVLVLENYQGDTLHKILNTLKKFSLVDFLDIAIKLSEALIDIYKCNIIHKSINPNNIIININNLTVKLTNFGNATFFSNKVNSISKITDLENILDYISPEQTGRMNHSVDYRADFYSLGILFYKMITGFLPFQAKDRLGIIHCHLAVKPITPHEIDSKIPKVVSDIIMKLLEKMPENRYKSAIGLNFDLQKCMSSIKTTGLIEGFEIAQKDFSDIFEIPNKLYGREKEILALKAAFQRIGRNQKEIIMVTGYSGVGKSQLIYKIRSSVKKQFGYFISGKFDQSDHNIPYSALIYSFKDLVKQILGESNEQIKLWRKRLLDALGSNGQIIISVIPEIELIIGKQPDVIEIPTEETKNRFFNVFKDFVRTFCQSHHPFIIFLDDLQWADLSSLKLIEILISDFEISNILFIGAYRDNEISEEHPLKFALENIQKKNITINTLFLKPLKLENIKQLISETFQCDLNESAPLAEISYQKTEGNPFFLNQFLYSLYKDQLIWFDKENWKWNWDLQCIKTTKLTDNVVDLISNRISKLSKDVINILKLASCIGNQFDIDTLSILCSMSLKNTYTILCEAIKEGIILPTLNTPYSMDDSNNLIPSNYTFLHDRIQQIVYSLIKGTQKKEIHLKIGKLMLSYSNVVDSALATNERDLLDIVNHLNLGIELIYNSYEKIQIAELELLAGKISKKSTAYDSGHKYLKVGIEIIGANGWNDYYDLTHSLYVEAAEIACLIGDFNMVEQYIQIALTNSRTVLDKVKLYEIRIISYTIQNKKLEVIDTALFILKLLGINFPKNPNKLNVLTSLVKTKLILIGKKPVDLYELSTVDDSFLSASLRIMIKMGMSTYMISPNLFLLIILKAVRLYVKHGNLDGSSIGYAAYGMLLCYIGDIDSGYNFGMLSLKLLDKFEEKEFEALTIVLFNTFVNSWKTSTKLTLSQFTKAYLVGLETGNIAYACTALCLYSIYAYYSGENLITLKNKMSEYYKVINKFKNDEALITHSIYQQSVLNLMGLSENTNILKGNIYDEDKMIPIHLEARDRGTLCNVYVHKSILSYIFAKYDEALENSIEAEKYLDGVNSTLTVPVFYFYNSLIMLNTFKQCSLSMKKQILIKVFTNQQKMKKWSKHSEKNFSHKYYLVKAEISRVLGNTIKSISFYEKAISLASENSYIQDQALANELAAKFFLSIENKRIAKVYMEEALYCYTLWGASAKVNQLNTLYSEILSLHNIDDSYIKNKTASLEKRTSSNSAILDTATIIKATHAISGEIILEELLKKLVYIT